MPEERSISWTAAVARLCRASLLLALGILAWLLWQVRLLPALGTDSLVYHLPIPTRWLSEGFLSPIDLAFQGGGVEQSPMLTQSLSYALIRLTGDTGLTWVIQPVFFLVLLAVLFRSARLVGASRALAAIVTAHTALFAPFLSNVQLGNNDLALTCGAALLLYGLLLTRRRYARGVIVAACGMALMLLTKAVGVIVSAVACLLVLPILWRTLRAPLLGTERDDETVGSETVGSEASAEATGSEATGSAATVTVTVTVTVTEGEGQGAKGAGPLTARQRWVPLAWAALIVALGGAFFWRNLWLYGNPVYPGHFRLGPLVLSEGLYDLSVLVDHGWSPRAIANLLIDGSASGSAHAITLPTSAVLWVGWAACFLLLFEPRWRERGWARVAACLCFPPLLFVANFALIPYWTEPRYQFPVYYALWLALAGGAAALGRRWPGARQAVPALLALWLLVNLGQLGVFSDPGLLVLALSALGVGWVWDEHLRAHVRKLGPLVVGGVIVVLACGGPAWYPNYRAERTARRALYPQAYPARGQAWALIDQLADATSHLTVAYSGTPLIQPLFGPTLKNRVVYLALSEADVPTPVDLRNRPATATPDEWLFEVTSIARRKRVDEAYWLAQLSREDVDFLYLCDTPHRGGVAQELALIKRNPRRFRLLMRLEGPPRIWVFAVLPDPSAD